MTHCSPSDIARRTIIGRAGLRRALGERRFSRNRTRCGRLILVARPGGLPPAPYMKLAVGKAHGFPLAAEMEVRMLRVADRPAAVVVGERLNGLALARRYYKFCVVQGHNARLSIIEVREDRCACTDDARSSPDHPSPRYAHGEQSSEIQGCEQLLGA